MMDLKTFVNQMLTPGTVPCTLFGMALGLIFAVLCLTIGVVKDKKKFVENMYLFFQHDENGRY